MKKQLYLSVILNVFMLQAMAQSAAFTSDSPRCINEVMHFTPDSPGGAILSESWDFGDGNTVIFNPPTSFPVFAQHVYANAGIFIVSRTVTFTSGPVTYNLQVTVIPTPVPDFTWFGTCYGQPVSFVDLSFTPWSGGTIVQWLWDFGDGTPPLLITFPSNPNVTHTFAGMTLSHIVSLTVTGSTGCTSTIQHVVSQSPSPVANFMPVSGCTGAPVQFFDLSQTGGGGPIVAFNWSFGDPASGANNTSTLQNPWHAFSAPGVYNVHLIVSNGAGCSDTIVKSIAISPAPLANFSWTQGSCAGDPVQFTDLSQPNGWGVIVSFFWDFGDGGTSNQQNPMHIFAASGTYNVSLTVSSNEGCQASIVKSVPILSDPPPPITGPTNLCVNNVANYSTSAAMNNYQWTVSGGGTILTGQATNQVKVIWPSSGMKTIAVSYQSNCGSGLPVTGQKSVSVTMAPAQNVNIPALSIPAGIDTCIGAEQWITAGALGGFAVYSGGKVGLVAGQGISLLPGVIVHSGGKLKGMIASACDACAGMKSALVQQETPGGTAIPHETEALPRIWPNPTRGVFTVDIPGDKDGDPLNYTCFNGIGFMILKGFVKPGTPLRLSLEGYPNGLYILRIGLPDGDFYRKVVKH